MKMKKILLIPSINISGGQIVPYIPYGLLSLQAAAHGHGSGVGVDILPTCGDLLEMKFQNSKELAEALLAQIDLQDYDTGGLSTMCNSFHHSLRIAGVIKQQAPGMRVWMGGPHVSVIARQVLEAFEEVDAVFVGEGELTFADVLNRCDRGDHELKDVAGVHTREYTYTPRKPIPNLDELHRIDLAEHFPVSLSELLECKRDKEVPLEAARGCPGHCSFCSTHLYWGRHIRRKSDRRILSEMHRLHDLTGIPNFHLIGDTFGTPRRRLLRFCETICSEASGLQWNCSLKLDDLEAEDLETLWHGGCRKFFVGVESASRETLKRIRKNVRLDRDLNIISNAVQRGFKVITSFIIGFPWETSESIDRTFKLHCQMLKLGVHRSQVCLLCPLPGTRLSKIHPVHFDHFISDIAQDDISMDNTTRELTHLYPGMFSQLGYYETPDVSRNELVALRDAASQLYHLHSMKDTNTTPVKRNNIQKN
jgi:tRNA A37 methylthiotransferase MiaB